MPPLWAGTAQSSGKGQHPERGHHRQGTAPRAGPLPAPNNHQPTDRSTSRPERPRARRRQLTGRSRRQCRGPERPGRPGQHPAKDTTRTTDQPPDTTGARHTTSNSIRHDKHHLNPRMKRGRETRQRAGHPPRLPIAGRGTGRQGPRLWAACRPARGLPWPCRPGQRPALPPAGGVPRAPPRANAREGGACAASARGGLNCGPPQGQGLQQQPAAGAPAWLGGGTPSEGPRAATPGGECVGRAERPGLRRRRGRAGKAGRSAADRAGGADGPKAPTSGGRAAPEHLRRDRRGGGAMQGRAFGPPRRGLALHCGGVPPRNGWRPT